MADQSLGVPFAGLPEEGFATFAIADRSERRQAIIDAFHPPLDQLARQITARLKDVVSRPLYTHLPRLDWPADYEPFCTWLALSTLTQGYQAGPQLNIGIHADQLSIRLGWDAKADDFSRFEFLCRHSSVGSDLENLLMSGELKMRGYAPAPLPAGSRVVVEASGNPGKLFDDMREQGAVWWEIGEKIDFPAERELLTSPALGERAESRFLQLAPLFERLAGKNSG